ncbi:MAG: L-idonate 5-dehydrogenase [Candidatus Methylomirabilota bacterium]
MRVCKIYGAEDLRVESLPDPEVGPGEVLLKLGAGGICGSDLHYFLHGKIGSFVIREPLIPGHEISGTAVRVGPGVTRIAEGDRVAVNPSRACGVCRGCRDGRENLCRNMRFLGSASVFPHMQGMFREQFVMPEAQCQAVPAGVSLSELAFAEPLAVSLHAVQRAGNLLGKRVLVTGAGPIGCLIIMVARLNGAAEVIVSDVVERTLQVASRVGADRCLRADQIPGGPEGFAAAAGEVDVALEAAGNPAAVAQCLAAVGRGGRIVQVGTLPGEGISLTANQIMAREIDYVGTLRFGVEFDWAVRILADRRLDVTPLLSGRYHIADAGAAFRAAADKTKHTKVQVVAE